MPRHRPPLRQKARILEARAEANLPLTPILPSAPKAPAIPEPVAAYIAQFREEQRLKRKRQSDIGNERKRQRQVAVALARSPQAAQLASSA